jgi:glyoxylase-like metal-dependent hydrolase (beta-lactamase superfamily II)
MPPTMTSLPEYVQPLSDGVYAIDTGFQRPRFDAAYLVVENGHAAFIDTGPSVAVPRLLEALDALAIAWEAVDFVIPTHVHLDHAGGCGLLMRQLPSATLIVHPRGARHLINPSLLSASARTVYGDAEFERSYGDIVPVDAQRVRHTADGMTLALASRTLKFFDTPGHARHHHCIWDERTRGFFTGDTFGLSYREFDNADGAWVLPSSVPTQFEPEALRASVRRLLAQLPQCLYLTHFGRLTSVAALGDEFLVQLDAMVALGTALRGVADRHAALRRGLTALYVERLRRHGCAFEVARIEALLEGDIELNAQGMGIWLDRTA